MASFLRRTMVQLGLVDDDEYDNYEVYDDPHQVPALQGARAQGDVGAPAPSPTVRPLPDPSGASVVVASRPTVRPVPPSAPPVQVVEPSTFADAQEIGEHLKTGGPVIVNLQDVGPDLERRLIDFCSGAVFVAGAKMAKVARQVFLLTPSNVEVSDEEVRSLSERGLYDTED